MMTNGSHSPTSIYPNFQGKKIIMTSTLSHLGNQCIEPPARTEGSISHPTHFLPVSCTKMVIPPSIPQCRNRSSLPFYSHQPLWLVYHCICRATHIKNLYTLPVSGKSKNPGNPTPRSEVGARAIKERPTIDFGFLFSASSSLLGPRSQYTRRWFFAWPPLRAQHHLGPVSSGETLRHRGIALISNYSL